MPFDVPVEGLYYLASPYSHPDPLVKELRYLLITRIAAELFNQGYALVEPIGSSHPVAKQFKLPTGYEYWQARDRSMISKCDGVIVAKLPGWRESVGVTDEIHYAKEIGKPVYYLNVDDLIGPEVFIGVREAVDMMEV